MSIKICQSKDACLIFVLWKVSKIFICALRNPWQNPIHATQLNIIFLNFLHRDLRRACFGYLKEGTTLVRLPLFRVKQYINSFF